MIMKKQKKQMASGAKAVELEYRLDVPVRDDIYDYLLNG